MGDVHVRGLILGEAPSSLGRIGLRSATLPDGSQAASVGGVTLHAVGEEAGSGLRALDLGPDAPAPVALGTTPRIEVSAEPHPIGAVAVDHVVVLAGDADAAVAGFGVEARRREERGGRVYAYVVAGTCLIEVVAPAEPDDRPPRLWGMALSVTDLDAAAALLGDGCGRPKDAVQPDRRIATLRGDVLGFTTPTVLLTPR